METRERARAGAREKRSVGSDRLRRGSRRGYSAETSRRGEGVRNVAPRLARGTAATRAQTQVQGTAKRLVGATQRELDAAGETPESLADEARADAEREKAAGNQAFASREYARPSSNLLL